MQKPIFSTRDIYLAATLVTLRFAHLGTDFQIEGLKPKPIGYFQFEDTPMLQEAKQKYGQSMLLVEPKLYMSNLQSLKAEVVNYFNSPRSAYNADAFKSALDK